MNRASSLFVVIVLLAACKGSQDERRANGLQWVTSSSSADRDKGAEMLRDLLASYPHDAKAMTYLGLYEVKRGNRAEAKILAQRALAEHPDATTAAHAQKLIDEAEGTPAPSVPASAVALPIALGKGVGEVVVGAPLAKVEEALGVCSVHIDAPPVRICAYPDRGIEVGLRDGKVIRVGLRGGSREMMDGDFARHAYRAFMGASPEGVRIGMSRDEVEKALGAPRGRYFPIGDPSNADGSIRFQVLAYPDRGLTLEVDIAKDGGGLNVGAIEIPGGMLGKPFTAK